MAIKTYVCSLCDEFANALHVPKNWISFIDSNTRQPIYYCEFCKEDGSKIEKEKSEELLVS